MISVDIEPVLLDAVNLHSAQHTFSFKL